MRSVPEAMILIVEDDPALREALADLLRDEGYGVVTAADGAAGIAAIEASPPALVISDVRMPRLDGLGLVSRVRALPQETHLPIIMISACNGAADPAVALDRGADDFL